MNSIITSSTDLTLDICSEDGSRTQFYQNETASIGRILQLLASPRIFSQAMLTLASEQSVSSIPTRSIDLIVAHTSLPPAIPLPPGWLDVVEMNPDARISLPLLNGMDDDCISIAKDDRSVFHAEIHTLGDWMVRLSLRATPLPTVQEQRHFRAHFFELPVIPFYLQTGGIGFINPQKITRITVFPANQDLVEASLPAGLLRCVRR